MIGVLHMSEATQEKTGLGNYFVANYTPFSYWKPEHMLETLKEMGVTRLSLGIENFDPKILEFNGRAHLEEEIYRAYGWARELAFDQINIDLIAGMVGESWDNWRECVRKTLLLSPESVTVYQMELPYNT